MDVSTLAEWQREVMQSDKLVVVEWYASWCAGCKKSYPDVCRLALDPQFRKAFKFVKVSIEAPRMKEISKAYGVVSLPSASVYGPNGEGLLATFGVPASKVKSIMPTSLKTIMANPTMAFALDPNGFVIVHGPRQAEAVQGVQKEEKERAKEDSGGGGGEEHCDEDGCAADW